MTIPTFDEIIEPNDQTAARAEHLDALRELVGNVYPNKFNRSAISGAEDTITNIVKYSPVVEVVNEIKSVVATLAERERPPVEIKDVLNARLRELGNVRVSGRLAVPPRVMGKAAFVHLSDGISRIQVYIRKDDIAVFGVTEIENAVDSENPQSAIRNPHWEAFSLLDHGDFVGVEGYLFITNTGELSVHVEKLQFLAKAMLPMPDKMHGIADSEIKQRQRYVDLIGSSLQVDHEGMTTRGVFETRAKVISSLRHFLEDHGYIEVETPMLTPKATGAAAKPFKTHHNALDIDLYARIAPELYLKRLVVGGFEKVYELNRNFRNEGISYKHNPEFTMLEFYCAYMDVEGMMNFCEELMRQSVQKATGGLVVNYEGNEIDFSKPFERVTMKEGIAKVVSSTYSKAALASGFSSTYPEFGDDQHVKELLDNPREVFNIVKTLEECQDASIHTRGLIAREDFIDLIRGDIYQRVRNYKDIADYELTEEKTAKRIFYLFETYVEEHLGVNLVQETHEPLNPKKVGMATIQPTFVFPYDKLYSPLAKASPENPNIAERFELFINGMEVANGFSELNDPKEQYDRFIDQMGERDRGDEEAMILDEDYIRALSYGMPPAAGIGIGIDRLVMLLTNKHSIRDVILFPHMRPEKRVGEEEGS